MIHMLKTNITETYDYNTHVKTNITETHDYDTHAKNYHYWNSWLWYPCSKPTFFHLYFFICNLIKSLW